jgi:hypothetical protein
VNVEAAAFHGNLGLLLLALAIVNRSHADSMQRRTVAAALSSSYARRKIATRIATRFFGLGGIR